ncbi:hypothetical protein H2201_001561 [Coniosporium apollinis]|uniref:Uncharacterized protein n=1 Tax=Coniosporium apollinis TaxID=61459 RepID=A0ABQ9P0K3_9PEZI|nr:hypothetical protein H2201_001561 [Coniosporium apollinis]
MATAAIPPVFRFPPGFNPLDNNHRYDGRPAAKPSQKKLRQNSRSKTPNRPFVDDGWTDIDTIGDEIDGTAPGPKTEPEAESVPTPTIERAQALGLLYSDGETDGEDGIRPQHGREHGRSRVSGPPGAQCAELGDGNSNRPPSTNGSSQEHPVIIADDSESEDYPTLSEGSVSDGHDLEEAEATVTQGSIALEQTHSGRLASVQFAGEASSSGTGNSNQPDTHDIILEADRGLASSGRNRVGNADDGRIDGVTDSQAHSSGHENRLTAVEMIGDALAAPKHTHGDDRITSDQRFAENNKRKRYHAADIDDLGGQTLDAALEPPLEDQIFNAQAAAAYTHPPLNCDPLSPQNGADSTSEDQNDCDGEDDDANNEDDERAVSTVLLDEPSSPRLSLCRGSEASLNKGGNGSHSLNMNHSSGNHAGEDDVPVDEDSGGNKDVTGCPEMVATAQPSSSSCLSPHQNQAAGPADDVITYLDDKNRHAKRKRSSSTRETATQSTRKRGYSRVAPEEASRPPLKRRSRARPCTGDIPISNLPAIAQVDRNEIGEATVEAQLTLTDVRFQGLPNVGDIAFLTAYIRGVRLFPTLSPIQLGTLLRDILDDTQSPFDITTRSLTEDLTFLRCFVSQSRRVAAPPGSQTAMRSNDIRRKIGNTRAVELHDDEHYASDSDEYLEGDAEPSQSTKQGEAMALDRKSITEKPWGCVYALARVI